MMNMMMGKKSPEDMTKMMGEMMPQMMEKMGPEVMSKMMGEMGNEEIEHMMLDMMPRMMDTCFSEMDKGRRQFMLTHCRSMLDQMEEKYLGPEVK
jgi:hypothetical protein